MRAVAATLRDRPADPVANVASLLLAPSPPTAVPSAPSPSEARSSRDDAYRAGEYCGRLQAPLSRALNAVVLARPVPDDPAGLVGELLLSGATRESTSAD